MQFNNYLKNSNKVANETTTRNDQANKIAVNKSEFSKIDMSYSHKTTFDVGKLVPIFFMECLPDDSISIDINTLIKMSIPSAPTMDAPRYDINLFYVPFKQVFPNFPNVIGTEYSGGSPEPSTSIPVLSNFSNGSNYKVNDLAAYLGVPINVDMSKIGFNISALPFRSYIKVWDEWYRDENLMPEVDYTNLQNINNSNVDVSNLWNTSNNIQVGQGLLPTTRLRDYFASVLPFILKGEIPIISTITTEDINNMFKQVGIDNLNLVNGGTPVGFEVTDANGNAFSIEQNEGGSSWNSLFLGNGNKGVALGQSLSGGANLQQSYLSLQTQKSGGVLNYLPIFDNNGLGAFNITQLRNALVKQHQEELDARGGTRYYEKLLTYWGIEVNPLEINRTEFIGGWSGLININNVVQSAPQTPSANTPLGTLGALSITTGQLPKTINYSSSQYGYIIGCITVRTNITYSQGLPRYFTHINNWDIYNPSFNGISEQPIYKYELFLSENANENMEIFGYNQPFADFKYTYNKASGYLSVNATDTYYNFYTYQDVLSSSPTLSNEWIKYPASALENTLLMNSSNQVENINDILADFYFKVIVSRAIPAYSIPGVDKI